MERGAQAAVFPEGTSFRLAGNVSEISRRDLYQDHQERITLWVEGAEPLYAEIRVPNVHQWLVGQRVLLIIMPISQGNAWESLT